jgi:DNA-binding MarR family transcriptional regulator
MNINDLTANELKVLECLRHNKRAHTSELSEQCKFNKTTIRNIMRRLVLFGLVKESIDINHPSNRREFQLELQGKLLLNKLGLVTDTTNQEIIVEHRNASIIKWLRTMANEFIRMADNLSIYDE